MTRRRGVCRGRSSPEIDYLPATELGRSVRDGVFADLAAANFQVEWGEEHDLQRAHELHLEYRDLALGLVDGLVLAIADRLDARAIATLDLRDFAPVTLATAPRLIPRDPLPWWRSSAVWMRPDSSPR